MKKIVLISIFMSIFFILLAQNNDIFYNRNFIIDNVTSLEIVNNNFDLSEMGTSLYKGKISISTESGYRILSINDNNKIKKFILLNLPYTLLLISLDDEKIFRCTDYSKGGLAISMEPHLWGAAEITSSSNLIENIKGKTVEYSASNLLEYYNLKPWVENEKDEGVGVKLYIKFHFRTNNIVFLNGFIDPKNLDLYKENNRIKKIRIESKSQNFNQVYELKDEINLQQIDLPIESKDFILTIEEVYKGSKFNDTCLTGLYTNYFGIWKNIQ